MPQTAFGLTDLFEGNAVNWSQTNPDLPITNIAHDDPNRACEMATGDSGTFEWRLGDIIDLDFGGGGPYTVTLAPGVYLRSDLVTALKAAFIAHDPDFDVYFNPNGKLVITNSNVAAFSLLWDTGANAGAANEAWDELGFDNGSDDTGAATYYADEARYGTRSFVVFDYGGSVSVDVCALFLDADDEDVADFSDVEFFASTANHGSMRQAWVNGANTQASFSTRYGPNDTNNVNGLMLAHQGSAAPTARRYYCVSWVHRDEAIYHRIGLCKGYNLVTDTTTNKTLTALQGHRLEDTSEPISDGHSRGIPRRQRWRIPLGFRLWPEIAYRAVVQKVVRHGKQRGILWMLDQTGVFDGSLTINQETSKGLIVWCSLVEQPGGDDHGGEGTGFISGTLLLRQHRG